MFEHIPRFKKYELITESADYAVPGRTLEIGVICDYFPSVEKYEIFWLNTLEHVMEDKNFIETWHTLL